MNKYTEKQLQGTCFVPINKGIVVEAPKDFDLYVLSDLHCGAAECNYELLRAMIKEIKGNRKARVILGGDVIEAIPRGYKIDERGQDVPPDAQVVITSKYLKPIAPKIICSFKGNHNTNARGESMDSDFLLAELLKVPYKTVPGVVQFKTPKGVVKVAGGHGKSGAKNGDIELEKLRNIFPNCSAYFLGHTHMLYAKHVGALKYDEGGNEHWDSSWFARTGNCLNYAEYARYSFYSPQRSGCVMFEIRNGQIVEGHALTDKHFGVQ